VVDRQPDATPAELASSAKSVRPGGRAKREVPALFLPPVVAKQDN
jgi:hypothetical protein